MNPDCDTSRLNSTAYFVSYDVFLYWLKWLEGTVGGQLQSHGRKKKKSQFFYKAIQDVLQSLTDRAHSDHYLRPLIKFRCTVSPRSLLTLLATCYSSIWCKALELDRFVGQFEAYSISLNMKVWSKGRTLISPDTTVDRWLGVFTDFRVSLYLHSLQSSRTSV